MARLGLGLARRRLLFASPMTSPPAPPASPAGPIGFARNGSANAALRAAVARVRAGTGRGRIIMKGDSTTVGQGSGTAADPYHLTGARANRPAAVLAAQLTAAGIPTLDGALVADNGVSGVVGVPLAAYDPRFAPGSPPWTVAYDQGFAGGGRLMNSVGGIASFTPNIPVDRFELVFYNAGSAVLDFAIDNGTAAIASGPINVAITPGTGFGHALFATSSLGSHYLQFACYGGAGTVAVASVAAWNSAVPAIDILVDAVLGATSANQATSGNGWSNLDHLTWAAPDVTIVNVGLNDMAAGVSVAAYTANLGAIVTAAKAVGDVLLVFPYPAAPSFASLAQQAAFRDAAAALASSQGVAFLSLFDLFGGTFTPAYQARLADRLVHGDAGLYADVGAAYAQALLAMVA